MVTTTDEYQRRLLRAAEGVLAPEGYPLIAHCDGSHVRGAGSHLLTGLLETRDPVGVLCVNALEQDDQRRLIELFRDRGLPTVHIGQEIPGEAWVAGDSEAGMRELLAHLLDDRGIRNPALVRGNPNHPDSAARERMVRQELAARGLALDEDLVITGNWVPAVAAIAMRELLTRRRDMDAVIAMNDQMACRIITELHNHGIRVPEDIAVTGFDDIPAAENWPGLTTVDQDLERQGAGAARLLLRRMAGVADDGPVVVSSRLVVRGSTAPAGEPAVAAVSEFDRMARSQRQQLAAQDAVVAMSHALDQCWTVADIAVVLATHLPHLGVARGFLGVYDRVLDDAGDAGLSVRIASELARLVLDLRDGRSHDPPESAYPSAELLPAHLRDELETGLLVLQPLEVLDRPIGFFLFEQPSGSDRLSELIRSDLSRSLESVFANEETEARTSLLERIVARRTQELQAEVVTRRRAERELQAANEVLHRSAMRDGLTGIANRAAFQAHLDRHCAAALASGEPLALLLADVDAFKPYNDEYGHVLGDEALRTVASCLEDATWGSDDLASRYGGEEFAVVLPSSGVEGALAVARRFRRLLADAAIPHATSPVTPILTASIGIAVLGAGPGVDPQSIIEAADRALYRAKALGRDRIEIADAPPSSQTNDRETVCPQLAGTRPRAEGAPTTRHG